MNRPVILSLLTTTAASWFAGAPAQPQPADADAASKRVGVASAALRCSMNTWEHCKDAQKPFGAMPAPTALRGAPV